VGDGRPFWRYIVQEASGCYDEAMFEEVRGVRRCRQAG